MSQKLRNSVTDETKTCHIKLGERERIQPGLMRTWETWDVYLEAAPNLVLYLQVRETTSPTAIPLSVFCKSRDKIWNEALTVIELQINDGTKKRDNNTQARPHQQWRFCV